MRPIELEADEEHEEDQAELGPGPEDAGDRGREEERVYLGEDHAQAGWARAGFRRTISPMTRGWLIRCEEGPE